MKNLIETYQTILEADERIKCYILRVYDDTRTEVYSITNNIYYNKHNRNIKQIQNIDEDNIWTDEYTRKVAQRLKTKYNSERVSITYVFFKDVASMKDSMSYNYYNDGVVYNEDIK